VVTEPTYTFEVGGDFGTFGGNARLTITPTEISMRSRFPPHSEIVHRERAVRLIRARLLPPWMNTTLILQSDGERAAATIGPWFTRKPILLALEECGYQLVEERRWLSSGHLEAAGWQLGRSP
jgi:hypothetical protein